MSKMTVIFFVNDKYSKEKWGIGLGAAKTTTFMGGENVFELLLKLLRGIFNFFGDRADEFHEHRLEALKKACKSNNVRLLIEDVNCADQYRTPPGVGIKVGDCFIQHSILGERWTPIHQYQEKLAYEKIKAFREIFAYLGGKSMLLKQAQSLSFAEKHGAKFPIELDGVAAKLDIDANFNIDGSVKKTKKRTWESPDFQPYLPEKYKEWLYFQEFEEMVNQRTGGNWQQSYSKTIKTHGKYGYGLKFLAELEGADIGGNRSVTLESSFDWIFEIEFHSKVVLQSLPQHPSQQ